jgi:acetate---CoA ligase (ADP-forming)
MEQILNHDTRFALRALFAPSSIAVVGASNDTAKMGGLYFQHLRETFTGRCFPISRRGAVVQGVEAFATLSKLPIVPDVVFVAVPSQAAIEVTREAADLRVPFVVLHTAGFAEAGKHGVEAEAALVDYARSRGTRIVGPNSMGTYGGETSANLLGLPQLSPGSVSFISASGTLIQMLGAGLTARGMGYRNVVGFENQADIHIYEYLQYCEADAGTRAIVVYMEGIRGETGRQFVDAMRAASKKKPVFVLRGATTSAGQRAALSHTASLVSPASLYAGLSLQAGIIELQDETEILPCLDAIERAPVATSRRVAVIGEGGGLATLTSDAMESAGLEVRQFSEAVQDELKSLLGPLAGVGNPVDAVQATDESRQAMLATILKDNPGSILRFGLFQDDSEPRSFESVAQEASQLGEISRKSAIPIVVFSPEGDADESRVALFRHAGIPVVRSARMAARVLSTLARGCSPVEHPASVAVRPGTSGMALSEIDGLDIVSGLGLNVPARRVYHPFQLRDFESVEYEFGDEAVVLKAVVQGVHHKSDIGGVRIGLRGADQVRDQALSMIEDIERLGHQVESVMVMRQVKQVGVELLLSGHRDRSIGPLVTVGSGGIFTEVYRDIISFAAPVSVEEAENMLLALDCSILFKGYRGRPAVNVKELAAQVATFSSAFAGSSDLLEVEVNPLIAGAQGSWAVDAIVVREDKNS